MISGSKGSGEPEHRAAVVAYNSTGKDLFQQVTYQLCGILLQETTSFGLLVRSSGKPL